MFGKIDDKLFVPALAFIVGTIGGFFYEKGKADAIHNIYKRGLAIVDPNDRESDEE